VFHCFSYREELQIQWTGRGLQEDGQEHQQTMKPKEEDEEQP
jgi:hypothetical protein